MKTNRLITKLGTLVAIFSLFILPASSNIIFVPGDVSSVSTAILLASVGDTVILEDGVYTDVYLIDKEIVFGSRYILDGDENHIENTELDRGTIFGQTTLTINGGVGRACVISGFTVSGGENYSVSIYDAGGGIQVDYSDPILDHLIIKDNDAEYGGGLGTEYASPIIQHCKFWNNQASIRGGALACLYGNPTIYGCEFYGNASSFDGAAIYLHGTVTEIARCTFSNNDISVWGSGKGVYCWTNAVASIHNSIFWNSTGNQIGVSTAYPGTWAHVGNCDVQGGLSAISNINVTIDGPILDVDPEFILGAHTTFSLSATSPAIDAGNNSIGATLDVDVNQNIVNGAAPDLGAYEYGTTTLCSVPGTLNAVVSSTSVNLSWASIAGADGYQVEGWNQATPSIMRRITSTSSSVLIPAAVLEEGADYEWHVRARCQPGSAISDWSELKDFTAPELALAKADSQLDRDLNLTLEGGSIFLSEEFREFDEFFLYNINGELLTSYDVGISEFPFEIKIPKSSSNSWFVLIAKGTHTSQSWLLSNLGSVE